jgi:uncharacterized oligopeptide transporter (OPT) family protein
MIQQQGLTRRYRMPIWIGFGLVGTTIIASILAILLSCLPFEKYWQINPDPGSESCILENDVNKIG